MRKYKESVDAATLSKLSRDELAALDQQTKDSYNYPESKSKYQEEKPVFVEGRDFVYKAKVGNKWLKGRELVASKKDADTFVSETEPTQRINQLKKKRKVRKGAKIKLFRMKEACMDNTIGYHLSPFSFSEPRINHGAGFGTDFYGAGFYITLDKNVLDVIKGEAQDIFAEYFIYTIQVDENANIVNEYEDNGLELYAKLVEQFNGDEVKASEEMVKSGIDGLLYYNEEDGHSIVFYNPKMAKIINTECHQGWGDRSELQENVFDDYFKEKINRLISTREKWNLKMSVEGFKKELKKLQATAADIPDAYMNAVCNFDSYPLEDTIDDDQNLEKWCNEIESFLDDSQTKEK